MAKHKVNIFGELFLGLLVIGLSVFVKVYFVEHSYFGHWVNAKGYELLHQIIPPFDREKELSVVVLDISDLKRSPDGTTPSQSLREIIEALFQSKAKAVAVDIDFSPRTEPDSPSNAGPRSDTDEEFFKFLYGLGTRRVFVGAYNLNAEPKMWLGLLA